MKRLAFFLVVILSDACVDRVNFNVESSESGILVIDGKITDQPGPYSVRLFRSSAVEDILNFDQPVIAKRVTLSDDIGNREDLINRGIGTWETDVDGMRGEVGRKYNLEVELMNGVVFESKPDEMMPPGEIENLYYNFETIEQLDGPPKYGFRVFMDAKGSRLRTNEFLRWRFTGTYQVITYPDLHLSKCPDGGQFPRPCSGAIISNGLLTYVRKCECCTCWVSDFETRPMVNTDVVETNGIYKKIELGFVPFNEFTFALNKYMLKVEQYSLSKDVYEFWKSIQDQKDNASSLFQPSFGKITSNFTSTNSKARVLGFFYASAVKDKVEFISSTDAALPVPLPFIPFRDNCEFWDSCDNIYPNASRIPPPEWN